MKVFITGATGFIGTAVTKELLQHGHTVLGLARNEASGAKVTKVGGMPFIGDIENLDSLRRGAAAADGVIHLAFHHEFMFSDFTKACQVDRAAIQAMGEAMSGTGKPLIIASGTLMMNKGKLAHEDDEPERGDSPLNDRALSGDLVRKLSTEQGIRGMEMRLSPTMHGAGDQGFMTMFIENARKTGSAVYIGSGENRWPACGRDDAAVLFRLALEKGKAGAAYHAVSEEGVRMKDIQELMGKTLGLPVESKQQGDAGLESLGFLAFVIGLDNPTSAEKTSSELGWRPTGPGLLQDLAENYFG